ncbi:hypothetical protein Sjap_024521 [Stephania japonica]|uniref:Cotton fiber protein n=1 Tax=Stephania japonica TaxID=461633 RepID=A0AAP0EM70_9MAGN
MTRNRTRILLQRARLFGISIFIEKIGAKAIAARLILISKAKSKLEEFKLFKHHHYFGTRAFSREFKFSPSSTLYQRHRRGFKKRGNNIGVCSVLFFCRGSSDLRVNEEEFEYQIIEKEDCAFGAFTSFCENNSVKELREECSDFGDEDDSVDRRAEIFIHKFYEEMRIQGEESDLQHELDCD